MPPKDPQPPKPSKTRAAFRPSRRQVIVTGLFGVVVLAGAGLVVNDRYAETGDDRFDFLNEKDRAALGAIAPVLLAGALPAQTPEREGALAEVLIGIDRAFAGLPPASQAEVRQLLDLLGFAPARGLLMGIWRRWENAAPADVEQFLQSWRTSRIELFRVGYLALHEVTMVAWYANPRAWPAMGYAGPPEIDRG
jgi:hypothetical protein